MRAFIPIKNERDEKRREKWQAEADKKAKAKPKPLGK